MIGNTEFYSKNKFEKLVHLVGFIIRIYHDAWSPERQMEHTNAHFLLFFEPAWSFWHNYISTENIIHIQLLLPKSYILVVRQEQFL